MDPTLTRETLERLIVEQAAVLARLEELLDREHGLLVARNIEALAAAGRDRQGCVGALLRLDDERTSLCRMLGYGSDADGMRKLLCSCDPGGRLAIRWTGCTELTRRCRKLNDRNGALATAQLRSVTGRLDALTGGAGSRKDTYSPQGVARVTPTGRLLAAQV
ncbi:MAG TPA: flagellar protein FlgN [Steroidobacteraceae bacterium]|nr:flagellar protein FlgN [Steroidobacteraceae bacterium]